MFPAPNALSMIEGQAESLAKNEPSAKEDLGNRIEGNVVEVPAELYVMSAGHKVKLSTN